jgi:hypothetical protein
MIDFRSRTSVETALFIKWEVPDFPTAYISDYNTDFTFGGNTYTSIGQLLSISSFNSELSASPNQLSISLSGIPTGSIATILNQEIKGSELTIYRGFFNPATHALLTVSGSDNPVIKFKGIVTNYELSDDVDVSSLTATTTILLTCSSSVEVLSKKTSGRRTNILDFPNEDSMSRVTALANSNFNFGQPGNATANTNYSIVGYNK